MAIRKTVTLVEEINSEYGAPASPPLRRVAIAENPLAGKAAGSDLEPLIEYSLEHSPRWRWQPLVQSQHSYARAPGQRW